MGAQPHVGFRATSHSQQPSTRASPMTRLSSTHATIRRAEGVCKLHHAAFRALDLTEENWDGPEPASMTPYLIIVLIHQSAWKEILGSTAQPTLCGKDFLCKDYHAHSVRTPDPLEITACHCLKRLVGEFAAFYCRGAGSTR